MAEAAMALQGGRREGGRRQGGKNNLKLLGEMERNRRRGEGGGKEEGRRRGRGLGA